jgi:hypothetical protein
LVFNDNCRKQFVCFENEEAEEAVSTENPAKIASVYDATVAVDTLDSEAWDNLAFAFGLQVRVKVSDKVKVI